MLNGGKCLTATHLSLKGIQAEKHPVRPVFFAFTQRLNNRGLISFTCRTGTRRAPDAFHPSSSRAHRTQHVPEEWTAQNHHMMNWTTLQVSVISSTLLSLLILYFRKKIFHLFWRWTPSLSGVTRRWSPQKSACIQCVRWGLTRFQLFHLVVSKRQTN